MLQEAAIGTPAVAKRQGANDVVAKRMAGGMGRDVAKRRPRPRPKPRQPVQQRPQMAYGGGAYGVQQRPSPYKSQAEYQAGGGGTFTAPHARGLSSGYGGGQQGPQTGMRMTPDQLRQMQGPQTGMYGGAAGVYGGGMQRPQPMPYRPQPMPYGGGGYGQQPMPYRPQPQPYGGGGYGGYGGMPQPMPYGGGGYGGYGMRPPMQMPQPMPYGGGGGYGGFNPGQKPYTPWQPPQQQQTMLQGPRNFSMQY